MMYEFKPDDAYRFAQHIGIKTFERGGNLHFKKCPYCQQYASRDEKTFAINLENGTFNCFRASCGAKGNMITLARDFDFSLGKDVDNYYFRKKTFRTFKTPEKPIEPKEAAIQYLTGRGISEEVIRKYEITTQAGNDQVIVFPFFDENGRLTTIKYRNSAYRKGIDKAKEWYEKDCKPILFGMKQCTSENATLTVCEGELDALSVATAGISNALSVPGGAKNFTWVPHCWDWVNSFDELIVFGDYENGHITLLEELSNKFHLTVKHVREEDYKDCKDANEILQKYGPEQIEECIKNAIGIPVEHVVSLADVPNLDVFEIPKLATGIDYLDRTLYGGLPFGGVTLITAKPGSGKSTLASQILVQAAEQGYRCFAYSGELSNTLFKSWMNFQVAGHHVMEYSNRWGDKNYRITDRNLTLISEWYRDKIDIFDSTTLPGDGSETENLLEIVEESIMRNGTQVVLIDNLMTAIDLEANRGTDKYERQSNFVKKVTRIALKHQVLILLVAHKRKNNFSNNENDEISGSGDIANLGMIVLSYDKDDQLDPSERVLKLSKNRLFGRVNTNGWALKFDEKSKRIYQPSSNPYFELSWNPDDKSYGFMDINEETPWG